jgi:membrane-associated phospholipid phosphatase
MWIAFTNIGDAAVTLPVAAICAIWLALFNIRLAALWIVSLTTGMALVGATKILHAGWGLSLPDSHFRMVSGHAMLSTSVWMVALALQLKWWRGPPFLGIIAGAGIGLLTGISRVMDHSHSLPEVLAGWLLGALVAAIFLRVALSASFEHVRPVWSTVSLLLVCTLAYGHKAPFQDMINAHSPAIHRHAPSFTALFHQLRYRFQRHEPTATN